MVVHFYAMAGEIEQRWGAYSYQRDRTFLELREDINAVQYSTYGDLLAASSKNGPIDLINVNTERKKIHKYPPKGSIINDIIFSPDDQFLVVSVSSDMQEADLDTPDFTYSTHIIETATGEIRKVLRDHKSGTDNATFSPDGNWLATTSLADKEIKLWQVSGWRTTQRFTFASVSSALEFTSDSKSFLSIGKDGNAVQRQSVARPNQDYTCYSSADDFGNADTISAFARSIDGRLLVAGFADGGMRLWQLNCTTNMYFRSIARPITKIVIANDNSLLVFTNGSQICTKNILSQATWCINISTGVNDFSLAPGNETIAVATGDKVEIWRLLNDAEENPRKKKRGFSASTSGLFRSVQSKLVTH